MPVTTAAPTNRQSRRHARYPSTTTGKILKTAAIAIKLPLATSARFRQQAQAAVSKRRSSAFMAPVHMVFSKGKNVVRTVTRASSSGRRGRPRTAYMITTLATIDPWISSSQSRTARSFGSQVRGTSIAANAAG